MTNEKRLIDADNAQVVAQRIYSDPVLIHAILNTLNRTPTVDAVEVVRCKDCKHRVYVDMGDDIGAIGGCELFKMAMPYDNFCSYGERKDNG